MVDFNDYGETDSVRWSMATLFGIGSLTILVLLMSDVTKDLASTGITLQVHSWSSVLFLWRFICLSTGVAAIVYMFRMKSGHMIVRSHEKKADVLIHPL